MKGNNVLRAAILIDSLGMLSPNTLKLYAGLRDFALIPKCVYPEFLALTTVYETLRDTDDTRLRKELGGAKVRVRTDDQEEAFSAVDFAEYAMGREKTYHYRKMLNDFRIPAFSIIAAKAHGDLADIVVESIVEHVNASGAMVVHIEELNPDYLSEQEQHEVEVIRALYQFKHSWQSYSRALSFIVPVLLETLSCDHMEMSEVLAEIELIEILQKLKARSRCALAGINDASDFVGGGTQNIDRYLVHGYDDEAPLLEALELMLSDFRV